MAEEETKQKAKRPTAQKRDLQNLKRRLINKSFKSEVRTSVRGFEEAINSKNKEQAQATLREIYSMMDRGVKRGVFKVNKASRLKANAAAKVAAL